MTAKEEDRQDITISKLGDTSPAPPPTSDALRSTVSDDPVPLRPLPAVTVTAYLLAVRSSRIQPDDEGRQSQKGRQIPASRTPAQLEQKRHVGISLRLSQ